MQIAYREIHRESSNRRYIGYRKAERPFRVFLFGPFCQGQQNGYFDTDTGYMIQYQYDTLGNTFYFNLLCWGRYWA